MTNKALNATMLGLLLGCPLTQAHADDGPLRLRTAFTGQNTCLDIVNDGQNNKPTMADRGNFSGQMWRTTGF
jgi:hypothetical protein